MSDFREEGNFMKNNIDDQIKSAEQKRLDPPEDKYLRCECGHSEEDHKGGLLNTECIHTIPYRLGFKYDCECEEFKPRE